MYQAAIRAIQNNFHTLSTLNRLDVGQQAYFLRKKGAVSQYFVTDAVVNFAFCLKPLWLFYKKIGLSYGFSKRDTYKYLPIEIIHLVCSLNFRKK